MGRVKRRVVELAKGSPKRGRLWAYGYTDLAQLLGMSEDAVRQAVRTDKNRTAQFDPSSLKSVFQFYLNKHDNGSGPGPTVPPPAVPEALTGRWSCAEPNLSNAPRTRESLLVDVPSALQLVHEQVKREDQEATIKKV